MEVLSISKSYMNNKKREDVLCDISFDVKPAEIFCILGENGAGKTTLIKIMLGLLKPDSGRILYKGNDIGSYKNHYYDYASAVLEGERNLYWYLSVYENMIYFGRLLKLNKRYIDCRIDELLDFFDLADEKDKKVGYLSRGMQQKLAVAIALINNPQILFLDEPTLGLDVGAKYSFVKKIEELAASGVTIILTSHQLDVVEMLANRIMFLHNKSIQWIYRTQDLIDMNREDVFELTVKTGEEACFDKIEAIKKTYSSDEIIYEFTKSQYMDILNILSGNNIDRFVSFSRKKKNLEEIILAQLETNRAD